MQRKRCSIAESLPANNFEWLLCTRIKKQNDEYEVWEYELRFWKINIQERNKRKIAEKLGRKGKPLFTRVSVLNSGNLDPHWSKHNSRITEASSKQKFECIWVICEKKGKNDGKIKWIRRELNKHEEVHARIILPRPHLASTEYKEGDSIEILPPDKSSNPKSKLQKHKHEKKYRLSLSLTVL